MFPAGNAEEDLGWAGRALIYVLSRPVYDGMITVRVKCVIPHIIEVSALDMQPMVH
jgi:hypothetical protein